MRLLVRSERQHDGGTLDVSGEPWAIRDFEDSELPGAQGIPEYTCVSYAWGSGRIPHPFDRDEVISDRALRVLGAVVRICSPDAVWIDALSVATEPRAKAETLRRLGGIYARAERVVVALSDHCLPLVQKYQRGESVDADALSRLEDEPWIKRFWTYQELAKSRLMSFLVERGSDTVIDGPEFLNYVGQGMWNQQKVSVATSLFPAVENLVDVLASWMHTGSEPFAYQVMAGLAERLGEFPADRFDAVLGVIAPDALTDASPDLASASERFMLACEAKGDLSFIYSTGPRSEQAGRSWRPAPGDVSPILAWHTLGGGQRGIVETTHVRLDELVCMSSGLLSSEARAVVEEHLSLALPRSEEVLSRRVLQQLRTMGFSGSGCPIELEHGFFLPQQSHENAEACLVLVATEVLWVHGAPALLVEPVTTGRYRCRGVGLFFGAIPKHGRQSFEIE